MYQSLIIVDDFYPNPHEVRKIALGYDYPEVTGKKTFPGRNSTQSHVVEGFDQVISQIVGEPVAGPTDPAFYHGCFRITLAGEKGRFGVHVDASRLHWVGVVYMNLPEQCRGGTTLYRHKALGTDHTPMTEEELRACGATSVLDLLERDGNDPDKWEELTVLPMRFNRLVLYRPSIWHSPAEPFGSTIEDGRLIQLVCFVSQRAAA